MKKIFALILVLVLLLFSVAAAESVEELLAQFTNDELQLITSMYASEIIRRMGGSFTLYPGIYIAGQDFLEGSYRFEQVSEGSAVIALYQDYNVFTAEISIPLFDKVTSTYTNDTIIGKLIMDYGNVLQVDGTFTVTPYTGLQP